MDTAEKTFLGMIIFMVIFFFGGSFTIIFLTDAQNERCEELGGYKIRTVNDVFYRVHEGYSEINDRIKVNMIDGEKEVYLLNKNIVSIEPCKGN